MCTEYYVATLGLGADCCLVVATDSTNCSSRASRLQVVWNITRILERQFLPRNFVHNSLRVIVAQTTRQLVIVHAWLVLAGTPQLGYLLREQDAELVPVSGPVNEVVLVGRDEEIQQKLPQLDGSSSSRNCETESEYISQLARHHCICSIMRMQTRRCNNACMHTRTHTHTHTHTQRERDETHKEVGRCRHWARQEVVFVRWSLQPAP